MEVMGLVLSALTVSALLSVVILTLKDTGSISKVLSQVTSARWILTVMAGAAFLLFSIAVFSALIAQKAKVEQETLVAIFGSLLLVIQGVYKDYFNRSREDNKPGGNKPPDGK